MNLFRPLIDRFFPPHQELPAGIYHYQAPPDAPFPYRLHLRIEPGGQGVLIVNASTIIHLNTTACEYAYHLVQHTPEDQAVADIAKRYNVHIETVRSDYHDLIDRLNTLIDTPDLDPVSYLDFDRSEPYTSVGSAPYRIDCALTYQLPDEGRLAYAPVDRVKRELMTEEWKQVLDKVWTAGVPHVIFTGGEPTLRPDLADLIQHAENIGMVAGLMTNGLRFAEKDYMREMLNSGLDHVMVLLDLIEDQCWECLRDLLVEDIAVTVHITLTHASLPKIEGILDRLIEMGVQTFSISARSLDLKDDLMAIRQRLAERQVHLVWDLPVPYSAFNPVALELDQADEQAQTRDTGAGQAWLYVEPDGDVLPGQGFHQDVLGNLVSEPWEAIWQKAQAWKVQ